MKNAKQQSCVEAMSGFIGSASLLDILSCQWHSTLDLETGPTGPAWSGLVWLGLDQIEHDFVTVRIVDQDHG